MPKGFVTFTDKSKSDLSLLNGWFSKFTPSDSSSRNKTTIKASTRGRDRRGVRYATETTEKKSRGAEIRRLGRAYAIRNARQNAVGSSSVGKKDGKVNEAADNNYEDADDGGSVKSQLSSTGSNYSVLLESGKSTKGEELSSSAGASGKIPTVIKEWQKNVTPLESVMKRPSIYSWYSASIDTQAIISRVASAGSAGSSKSTQSTASVGISGSIESVGSLASSLRLSIEKDQSAAVERKKESEGSRKSISEDEESKLKDFFDYFPWLRKLRDKKRSIDERLAGMDIDAAAAAGEKEGGEGEGNMVRFEGESERDSEWLHYSSSSDSNFFKSKFRMAALKRRRFRRVEFSTAEEVSKDEEAESEAPAVSEVGVEDSVESSDSDDSTKMNTQLACEFIAILLPLFRVMQFMGRFPIEITADFAKGTVEFRLNYRSPFYFAFCGTSFLIGLAFVSLTIQVSILPKHFKSPSSSYQEILLIEFEKYSVELGLAILSLFMLTASDLTLIYGDGVSSLVDFLNRLTFSIALLQNDVTLGLKKFLIAVAVLFCVYATIFTILFFVGRNERIGIPTCRDSSGVLFLFMVDNIHTDLRLTRFYAVMEYIGLFIHLYVCLSVTLIITLMLAFCIVLNNAATQFHVKLEETLCKEKEVSTKSELRKRRMTVIRKSSSELGNLFQEHLAVNSLARQFGNVFIATFVAFLFAKMFGTFIAFYSLNLPPDNPHSSEKYLDISSITYINQEKVVPIRNQETELSTVIRGAYYCFENVLTAWIVLEIAQKPGATLMGSENYVRRRGLIFCTNAKERRFISSMLFSFSPRVRWSLHPGMNLTREIIAKLSGFVLLIAFTLLQFNHARTNTNVKMICDKVGVCTEVSLVGAVVNQAEVVKSISFEEVVNDFAVANEEIKWTTESEPTTTPPNIPTTTAIELTTTTTKPTTTTPELTTTTAIPETTTTAKPSDPMPCIDSTKELTESEIVEDCGGGIFQPYLFYKSPRGMKRLSRTCDKSGDFHYTRQIERVFDCYGNVVPWNKRKSKPNVKYLETDECRNHPAVLPKTPDDLNERAESPLVLEAFYGLKGVDLYCCFKYGGLGARSNPPCSFVSLEEANKVYRCKKGPLPIADLRESMELKLWNLKEHNVYSYDELWTNCVCGKDKSVCELVKKSLGNKNPVGKKYQEEGGGEFSIEFPVLAFFSIELLLEASRQPSTITTAYLSLRLCLFVYCVIL